MNSHISSYLSVSTILFSILITGMFNNFWVKLILSFAVTITLINNYYWTKKNRQ